MQSQIKTSVFIVSDTHGLEFNSPSGTFDVAIHCGDLTDGSKMEEFHRAIKSLSQVNASLKLAIAGNHDFTLDIPAYELKIAEAVPALDPRLVVREYGRMGKAKALFEEANILLLDEGNHEFKLANGALLKIYASPYTPSMGAWGFQYHPDKGHDFSIAKGTDIAITHGPPKGIMDFTYGRERAGCPNLFTAIAQAKPRVHCFGHIHEGWGARQVTWREIYGNVPTHFNAIDNDYSAVIEKLSTLEPSKFDDNDEVNAKQEKKLRYKEQGCIEVDLKLPQDASSRCETLFVNAAIADSDGELSQLPWVVNLDLPGFAATS